MTGKFVKTVTVVTYCLFACQAKMVMENYRVFENQIIIFFVANIRLVTEFNVNPKIQ